MTSPLLTPVRRTLLCVLTITVSSVLPARAEPQKVPPPDTNPLGWKVGDGWHLRVKARDTTAERAFDVHAVVTAAEVVGSATCWRMEFIPVSAPAEVGKGFRAWLNPSTGHYARLRRRMELTDLTLGWGGGLSATPEVLAGFPLVLLPLLREGESQSPDGTETLRIGRQPQDEKRAVWEATLTRNGKPTQTIRQTWVDGEPWWRDYEQTQGPTVVFSALRVTPEVLAKERAPTRPTSPPAIKVQTPPTQTGASDPFRLRHDPRLSAWITVTAMNPPRAELMAAVTKATGVKLTVAENLANLDPKYGSVQLDGVRAWSVMEMMAIQNLTNGRWVETPDGGYCLEGEDKPTILTPPPASAEPPPATAAQPQGRRWLTLVTTGALIVLTLGFVGWRLWSARRKPE